MVKGQLRVAVVALGLCAGVLFVGGCAHTELRPAKTVSKPVHSAAEGVDKGEPGKPKIAQADLDARALEELWSFYLGEEILGLWVVDDAAIVYAKIGGRYRVYSVGLNEGAVRWVYSLDQPLASPPTGYNYGQDALKRQPELFLVAKDVMHVLDRKHGYLLWKLDLPFAASSSASASMSHIYVGSWDNRLYAISKDEQRVEWSYRTTEPVTAEGTVAEGSSSVEAVFFGSEDGNVFALSPVRALRKWSVKTLGAVVASPLYYRTFVYVPSRDTGVYCIRGVDGTVTWKYATGAPLSKPLAAFGGDTLLIPTDDNRLICLNRRRHDKKEVVRWQTENVERLVLKTRRDIVVESSNGQLTALAEDSGQSRWKAGLTTGAAFVGVNLADPNSRVTAEQKVASILPLGFKNGWLMALREKRDF